MLTHPTTDRLRELGLAGMARALEEQRRQPDNTELGFEDRLAFGKAGFVKHTEAYDIAGRRVGLADLWASTPEAAPDAGSAQRVTMPVDCSENGRMPVDNLHSRVREVAA